MQTITMFQIHTFYITVRLKTELLMKQDYVNDKNQLLSALIT